MKIKQIIVILIIMILPFGYLALDYGREVLYADACLDHGGSYNYEKQVCDFVETHEYVPYYKRKKILILLCLSLSGIGMIMVTLIKRKKY